MKQILLFLWCMVCMSLPSLAQHKDIVLADVSGNPSGISNDQRVTTAIRQEAEAIVLDLMQGKYSASGKWQLAGVPDQQIQDIVDGKGSPLLKQGGYLMVMPFGEKERYEDFKVSQINTMPSDLLSRFGIPWGYDQQTFGRLAEAKAADVAIDINQSSYYLIMISGLGEDTDSDAYNAQELKYLDTYRSAASIDNLGIIRYQGGPDFKIEISRVDLGRITNSQQNTTGTKKVVKPKHVPIPSLELITPRGNRTTPLEVEKPGVLVSWTCLGCSDSTVYDLRVVNTDAKKTLPATSVTGTYSKSLTLTEEGTYKITVSIAGKGLADTQYVRYETSGGGGFFLFLLLLALLGGGGYWVYKQYFANQGASTASTGSTRQDDDFFKNKGASTGNHTSGGTSGGGSAAGDDYF